MASLVDLDTGETGKIDITDLNFLSGRMTEFNQVFISKGNKVEGIEALW